jgi:hypothetical protein
MPAQSPAETAGKIRDADANPASLKIHAQAPELRRPDRIDLGDAGAIDHYDPVVRGRGKQAVPKVGDGTSREGAMHPDHEAGSGWDGLSGAVSRSCKEICHARKIGRQHDGTEIVP